MRPSKQKREANTDRKESKRDVVEDARINLPKSAFTTASIARYLISSHRLVDLLA